MVVGERTEDDRLALEADEADAVVLALLDELRVQAPRGREAGVVRAGAGLWSPRAGHAAREVLHKDDIDTTVLDLCVGFAHLRPRQRDDHQREREYAQHRQPRA